MKHYCGRARASASGRLPRFTGEDIMIIIVQHTVSDFDAWKKVFDEHEAVRRRHGATGHQLYRSVDDPNEVTVVNQFPTREQAEAFATDPSLKEAMERGGVVGEPRVTWAVESEDVDYRATRAA
jgi:heme-degrading monooxygenase HmoA